MQRKLVNLDSAIRAHPQVAHLQQSGRGSGTELYVHVSLILYMYRATWSVTKNLCRVVSLVATYLCRDSVAISFSEKLSRILDAIRDMVSLNA